MNAEIFSYEGEGIRFNTMTQKDTKLVYIQDAGTTAENSQYCNMTQKELSEVKEKAAAWFN